MFNSLDTDGTSNDTLGRPTRPESCGCVGAVSYSLVSSVTVWGHYRAAYDVGSDMVYTCTYKHVLRIYSGQHPRVHIQDAVDVHEQLDSFVWCRPSTCQLVSLRVVEVYVRAIFRLRCFGMLVRPDVHFLACVLACLQFVVCG